MPVAQGELKPLFLALPLERRSIVLALWAHNLTVTTRGWYPGQAEPDRLADKLVTLNELQHQVTGQLVPVLRGDSRRYPDDVFIDILIERAREGDCVRELVWSFEQSMRAA